MENPWHNLPSVPPYLLASDRDIVLRFNSCVDTVHQIRHEVMPEPYLGRPDAEIVLLNLNPGFDEQDQSLYEQKYGRVIWRKNIFHEQLDYPFYLLDPEFKKWPGPKWWRKKTEATYRTRR